MAKSWMACSSGGCSDPMWQQDTGTDACGSCSRDVQQNDDN